MAPARVASVLWCLEQEQERLRLREVVATISSSSSWLTIDMTLETSRFIPQNLLLNAEFIF
jgi:hypothetical protein